MGPQSPQVLGLKLNEAEKQGQSKRGKSTVQKYQAETHHSNREVRGPDNYASDAACGQQHTNLERYASRFLMLCDRAIDICSSGLSL